MAVVVFFVGSFDGEMDSRSLDATTRDVSGESNGAFVNFGSASRVAVALPAFLPRPEGFAIIPTALGVGVKGGGVVLACVRFLVGVDGCGGWPSELAFRFRPFGTGGGGIASGTAFFSAV